MKFRCVAAAMLLLVAPAFALDGQPGMHDPSTVIQAGGKFYVYATGNGLPAFVSDDGWTWRRAGSVMQAVSGGRPGPDVIARGGNNSWAPDVIRAGDHYFLYYAAPGPQPKAAIGLLIGKTLDPSSPDYTWEDGGPVVWVINSGGDPRGDARGGGEPVARGRVRGDSPGAPGGHRGVGFAARERDRAAVGRAEDARGDPGRRAHRAGGPITSQLSRIASEESRIGGRVE